MTRSVHIVDGEVVVDTGDPSRPEYDPTPTPQDQIAALTDALTAVTNTVMALAMGGD